MILSKEGLKWLGFSFLIRTKTNPPVDEIVSQIAKAGHDVRRDEEFLSLGDSIVAEIRQEIADSDFTLVFVSSHSTSSEWLARARSLRSPVPRAYCKSDMNKLIPCFLGDAADTDLDARLGVRVGSDRVGAAKTLLDRFQQGPKDKTEDLEYMVINIPVHGLEIYLTGHIWDWQRYPNLKYREMISSYLLSGFSKEPGTHFKHFVLCDHADADRIGGQIKNAGYLVKGDGSIDRPSGRRRVWFTRTDYPIVGPNENNVW